MDGRARLKLYECMYALFLVYEERALFSALHFIHWQGKAYLKSELPLLPLCAYLLRVSVNIYLL